MLQLKIPAGTQLLVAPRQSTPPDDQLDKLLEMIAGAPGISEAHLPQCFAVGIMEDPALVLTVILEHGADADSTLQHLASASAGTEVAMEVWLLRADDPLGETIRQARSQIYPPETPG